MRPSDDAVAGSTIAVLDDILERREQRLRNLSHAEGLLNNIDAALADGTDLMIEAKGIKPYTTFGVGAGLVVSWYVYFLGGVFSSLFITLVLVAVMTMELFRRDGASDESHFLGLLGREHLGRVDHFQRFFSCSVPKDERADHHGNQPVGKAHEGGHDRAEYHQAEKRGRRDQGRVSHERVESRPPSFGPDGTPEDTCRPGA